MECSRNEELGVKRCLSDKLRKSRIKNEQSRLNAATVEDRMRPNHLALLGDTEILFYGSISY